MGARQILLEPGNRYGEYMDGAPGYVAGEGGSITQITSATTGVTLNTLAGQITTVSLANTAGVDHTFVVTNSKVAADDVVVACTGTYGGTADGIPVVNVAAVAAGSFTLNVNNQGAAALDALATINFAVIRGATA